MFDFFQNLNSSSLAFLCTCPNCCKSNPFNFSFYLYFTSFLFTFHSRISVHFLQVLSICWNSLCVKVKVMQLCLTLCYLMDCRMPGSSVHGILQTRILERLAVPFARESSQDRDQTKVSLISGWFFIIWTTREALKLCI